MNKLVYMTSEEFADLIVDCLDDSGYFKRDQKAHPEDMYYAFESVAKSIAFSMAYLQSKIIREQAKNFNTMLNATDLQKEDFTNNYSENKMKKKK